MAGSGAQLAVGNIAGTVATVTSTGGTGFSVGDIITFTGTTGSGATATVGAVSVQELPDAYIKTAEDSNYRGTQMGLQLKSQEQHRY